MSNDGENGQSQRTGTKDRDKGKLKRTGQEIGTKGQRQSPETRDRDKGPKKGQTTWMTMCRDEDIGKVHDQRTGQRTGTKTRDKL
jgi:hypothetical protein